MNFEQILRFLDGRKAVIATILMAVNTYLLSTGVIDSGLASLIATIITALTGVAVQQTNRQLGAKYRRK